MMPNPFDPYVPPTASPPVAAAPAAVYRGPFEREAFPARLTARVVTPGPGARLRGYHVADDLARHYGATELCWLALRGELPTEPERAALDVAAALLAPVHVGQAPAHAACLARIAGATTGATLAIAAIGLGELVRHERAALAPWLAWLDDGGPVPACALAIDASAEEIAAQAWLDGQLRAWFGPTRGLPSVPLSRLAQGYAVLHHLGLSEPLAIEAIALWARLPVVAAEAAHVGLGAIRDYPARLPDYRYVDDAGAAP
jgi:hypothetical protein